MFFGGSRKWGNGGMLVALLIAGSGADGESWVDLLSKIAGDERSVATEE